jgi:hypothetical protein
MNTAIVVLAILSIITGLLFVYEGIALLGPWPTISRLIQGVRDSGGTASTLAHSISLLIGAIGLFFSVWLPRHLRRDKRSDL